MSGLPDETFTLTSTKPTNGTYDFIGWNTKQNGAGVNIEEKNDGEDWTFEDLADKAGDAFQDGKVTLYAQWGYVLGPHAGAGVRVTFDSNANDGDNVTEANPAYKDVELNTSIGEGNMPDPPTRDGYKFDSWNTKPNGTGDTVNESYEFTQEKNDPDNDANTTVYAQWTVDTEGGSQEITITFDTNGGGAASPTEMKIKKGDALAALPDTPTKEGYKFLKWALDKTEESQAVTVGSPKFENDDIVYAVWEKTLRFDIGYNNPAGDWNGYNQTVYNGENQPPTYVKVYDITNVGEEDKLTDTSKDVTTDFQTHYTLKYHLSSQDAGSADTTAPKDVGEYKVVVELDNNDPDAKVSVINPGTLSVVKQGVTVAVTETTQEVKVSSSSTNAAEPTITVTDAQSAPFSDYETKYYKWTPSDTSDLTIDAGEVASDATDASALTVGWYVVKVTLTDDNYEIGTVTGKVYDGSGGLPTYAGAAKGENIVFHVILNDPKATDLKVSKPDGSDLDLKDDNYTTAKPFDPEEKTDTDYYVRADKDTDEVDITVEAEPDYDVKVEFNGHVVEKDPSDGKYHIEGLEGAKEGSSNDVKVTVTPKNADTPKQEYTIHVQRLVEAKIEFKPGNSPYGLIERMSEANGGSWDADKVAAAKTAFDGDGKGSKFTAGDNLPNSAKTNITYWSLAWNEDETLGTAPDGAKNMDKDPNALFIYQGDALVDPGYTATDSEGNKIESPSCTLKMTVSKISHANATDMGGATSATFASDSSGDYTFDRLSATVEAEKVYIRPGVYKLEYTISDPVTGEDITASRNVVVLWELGDVDMTLVVNPSDATNLNKMIRDSYAPLDGVTGVTRGLYYYRICDFENFVRREEASRRTERR